MATFAGIILSNETELAFGVQIREDRIIENTEMFMASLRLPVSGDIILGLDRVNVSIVDNDGKCMM